MRESTKHRRLDRLMEVQREISSEFNLSRLGKVEKVLVDSWFTEQGVLVCRSEFESPEVDGEILVKYDVDKFGETAPDTLVGKFINVKLVAADDYDIAADYVSLAE